MSTPFLLQFSQLLIDRLVADDLIELGPAGKHAVVVHVAAHLASAQTASLISTVGAALLSSPDVDELYADDDTIKEIVGDLGPGATRGR